MIRFLSLAVTLVAAILVFVPAVRAETAPPVPAGDSRMEVSTQLVSRLGDDVLTVLQRKDVTKAMLSRKFREILTRNFDMDTIGRFVLGPYWKQATPAQQKEYMGLFREMIIELYTNRFIKYSGETFETLSSRPQGERDVIVESRIVSAENPAVLVGWRIRTANGKQQIVDVIVEGVSMGVTQRSDFAAVIESRGGIDGLLSALRERIEKVRNGGTADTPPAASGRQNTR
ncbi:MAG: ABC transporter substrate-binding protein [Pseudomonadota bacterium]|nr:ABC transporter substrate-binding protein [Pseudomonadota bacterium]